MTARAGFRSLAFGFALALPCSGTAYSLGDSAKGGNCSIASVGESSQNNVTCNFGLTPEQLRIVTTAAVEGAVEPLADKIASIGVQLGVTKEAARTLLAAVGKTPHISDDQLGEALLQAASNFKRLQMQTGALMSLALGGNDNASRALLKIIEESPDIPDDQLANVTIRIVTDYKRLQDQVANLTPENRDAQKLVRQARDAISEGELERAHNILREAVKIQRAAAEEAQRLLDAAMKKER